MRVSARIGRVSVVIEFTENNDSVYTDACPYRSVFRIYLYYY